MARERVPAATVPRLRMNRGVRDPSPWLLPRPHLDKQAVPLRVRPQLLNEDTPALR